MSVSAWLYDHSPEWVRRRVDQRMDERAEHARSRPANDERDVLANAAVQEDRAAVDQRLKATEQVMANRLKNAAAYRDYRAVSSRAPRHRL